MGQSLTRVHLHVVYGTKYRKPLITEWVEEEYHKWMTGYLKNLDCPILQINSMPDHTHILLQLSKNYSIAKLIEVVKKDSSKFMKSKGIDKFQWQGGYGAFSVSESQITNVKNYIKNQKKHHKIQSYSEEVGELMRKHNISKYSEDYFWA